jgi:hypothetical protein
MYVVVAGGGMVGGGLVRRLLDNKHDVVAEWSAEVSFAGCWITSTM